MTNLNHDFINADKIVINDILDETTRQIRINAFHGAPAGEWEFNIRRDREEYASGIIDGLLLAISILGKSDTVAFTEHRF